jgi:hypothetical protein
MDSELASRAQARRAAAGDTWLRQKMSFFFPGNEDTVDLCVMAVLRKALEEDRTALPIGEAKRVRDLIGTTTVIDDAVTVIFLATARPVRVRS